MRQPQLVKFMKSVDTPPNDYTPFWIQLYPEWNKHYFWMNNAQSTQGEW